MTTRYLPDDHLDGRTLLVAASYVVLLRDREVLLLLRQGTGYRDGHWATLAGHVDPGESVHEAAVREAAEESGVTIAAADLEPLTTLHRFQPDGPQVEQRCDVFFAVRTWSGEPTVQEPDKAAAMGWFSLDALPDPVVPHERHVLCLLRDDAAVPAVLSLPG
ncbi:MAG TPA: NUDIX domain-containing protein [Cellulomonas sp.]